MRIIFHICSPHGAALENVEWPEEHPLGGSETAVLRMAEAMRSLGAEAVVVTDESLLQTASGDVFVSLRTARPFAAARLPGRLNYLWCQDDVDQATVRPLADARVAEKVYSRCDGVILLSHYQRERWMRELHLPEEKIFMSSNGIPARRFRVTPSGLRGRAPRAYYSSVPWRGLEPLLQAWPMIHAAVPGAELVVFSSMGVYREPETDETGGLYAQARKLEGVVYRGSVGQRELREVAATCRVLAYPCVFAETSCIAAMEAMASGCVVVSTALGALPETAWRNPLVTPGPGWLDAWAFQVARALVDDEYQLDLAHQNLTLARTHFDWVRIARSWLTRMRSDFARRGEAWPGGTP